MSNDGFGPPPDDESIADEPTQAIPVVPPPPSVPEPGSLPPDATQVMPVVPSLPEPTTAHATTQTPTTPPCSYTTGAGGTPPYVPGEQAPAQVQEPDGKTATIIGVLFALAFIVGGAALFFALQGGDDTDGDLLVDATADPVSLSILRQSAGSGEPLVRTIAVSVAAVPVPTDFTWVVPGDTPLGEPGIGVTDGSGRADFRWQPAAGIDLSVWSSTLSIIEPILPEVTDIVGECLLDRDGSQSPLVISTVVTAGVNATTSFPNLAFVAGDRIECVFVETSGDVLVPVDPTVSELPTTVPEQSTTVPETTAVPETTVPPTTVEATTTTTTTTLAATTTVATTEPPAPTDPAVSTLLAERPELSEALALMNQAGFIEVLQSETNPFTLFVPDNDAIEAFRAAAGDVDLSDDNELSRLFFGHVVAGEALSANDLQGRDSVTTASGGPRAIDAGSTPLSVGGSGLVDVDIVVDGGVIHVVDTVLPPA